MQGGARRAWSPPPLAVLPRRRPRRRAGYVGNFLAYRGFDPPREPAFVGAARDARARRRSEPRARRPQAGGVRLPPVGVRAAPVAPVLRHVPAARLPRTPARVHRDRADGDRRGRADSADGRAQPLILVMPFGSTGTFTDEEWVNGTAPGNGWTTFVAHDLVRYVDSHYRTIRTARGRAIGGLSEGGFGAVNIALHHRGEFSVVESWSGYKRPDKLHSVFGPKLQLLPRTTRGCSCRASARASGRSARTSGSTRARRTGSRARTRAFARSSTRCGCRTTTGSSTAVTTGRSGARTRASPTSPRRRGSRVVRALARRRRGVLSLGVLVAATGWLYVARRRSRCRPGHPRRARPRRALAPRERAARPLPRGLGHVAAVLLALLARWAGADRLTAGLLLGARRRGWLYALNGISILVVRQISAHEAFQAAATEQAVIVPAVSPGSPARCSAAASHPGAPAFAAVARLARCRRRRARGCGTRLPGAPPVARRGVRRRARARSSKALVAPLAAVLIVAARSLARGNRRAWQIAVVLLAVLLVLHMERRFDEGAIVTGVVVVALLARRADSTFAATRLEAPRCSCTPRARRRGRRRVRGRHALGESDDGGQPYSLRSRAVIGRALVGLTSAAQTI